MHPRKVLQARGPEGNPYGRSGRLGLSLARIVAMILRPASRSVLPRFKLPTRLALDRIMATDRLEQLQAALARGREQRDLRGPLAPFERRRIRSANLARPVVDTLRWVVESGLIRDGDSVDRLWTPLADLIDVFTGREALNVLRREGVELLIAFTRQHFESAEEPLADAAMGALRLLGRSGSRDGADLIVELARRGADTGFGWSDVFEAVADNGRQGDHICRELRDPLPSGFRAVALLDMANTLAFAERLKSHPFDTDAGIARLEEYLTDAHPDRTSYAISAARALPYLSTRQRENLLALAFEPASCVVNLEAAWASAQMGSEAGVKVLGRLTCDPHASHAAIAYLEQLDRGEVIPAAAREPNFQALAEMSSWLQHPSEYGRAPDEIELYDAREIFWPPTGDVRPVWLVRYAYSGDPQSDDPQPPSAGVGMVGSITFALFDKVSDDQPPLDIYGLYCCWELEVNADPRTPDSRTAAAGRAILSRFNPLLEPHRIIPPDGVDEPHG